MNERIRELWDKAAESTAAYPTGQNNSWETQVNFMEKFAELIVRECITAVENTDRTHAYTTFDKQLIDATIMKSVQSINKHFK